jgi:hypothetical protein
LLGCGSVHLQLKKLVLSTGGSGGRVRIDCSSAIGDVAFRLSSRPVASKQCGEKASSGWRRGV